MSKKQEKLNYEEFIMDEILTAVSVKNGKVKKKDKKKKLSKKEQFYLSTLFPAKETAKEDKEVLKVVEEILSKEPDVSVVEPEIKYPVMSIEMQEFMGSLTDEQAMELVNKTSSQFDFGNVTA